MVNFTPISKQRGLESFSTIKDRAGGLSRLLDFLSFLPVYELITTAWFASGFLWLLHLATGFRLLTPASPSQIIFLLLPFLFLLIKEGFLLFLGGGQIDIRDFSLIDDDIGDLCIIYVYIVFWFQLVEFRLNVLFCLKFFMLNLRMCNYFF